MIHVVLHRKMGFTVHILAVTMAIGYVTCQTCDDNQYVNGCSIPFGLPFPFKEIFYGACNKHDICYECVCMKQTRRYYGITRKDCDDNFKTNMVAACNEVTDARDRKWCKRMCYVYYAATRLTGFLYFYFKKTWCEETWTEPCMQ